MIPRLTYKGIKPSGNHAPQTGQVGVLTVMPRLMGDLQFRQLLTRAS
jgi:hypothetical protein